MGYVKCRCPSAGSGELQRLLSEAPTDPRQGKAEALSQDGGASGKTYVRKGKTLPSSEGKTVRNSPASTHMRERGAPGNPCSPWRGLVESGITLQPMERPQQSRHPYCSLWKTPGQSRFILKDCSLWRGPILKQGRRVQGKKRQKGAVTD